MGSNKCRHPKCNTFARKLTGTEIDNFAGFNLSPEVCREIFILTLKGFCPHHAAASLKEELRPDPSVIDVLRRKWNYSYQNNFSDSRGYALCCICATSLAGDRVKHPVSLIEETLAALSIPKTDISMVLWLQSEASGGRGKCFDCSLITHTLTL